MLDMNCAWADRNPEWPSTAHILAGHLATVCLPEQAATHYIVASQVLYTRRLLLFSFARSPSAVCVVRCVCVDRVGARPCVAANNPQILQQQQQWDTAVIADLFACLALMRASAFKKAPAHAPLYSTAASALQPCVCVCVFDA